MKLQSVIALVATASLVAGKPLHKGLNYERYLQEKNATIDAFLKYRETEAFSAAVDLGLVNKEDRDGDPTEDQLQRFHMASELCYKMSKLHPDAEFSVNGPFTLMTADEFSEYVGPVGPVAPTDAPGPAPGPKPSDGSGGGSAGGVDWKARGCVTGIRNQGQCGSCWAFATAAAIESAMCIKGGNGKLPELSEQQITSCDTQNGGCGGGVPAYAIDFVKQNGGLCALEAYPYTPVAVAVAAGNNAWKQYKGGVLAGCDTTKLDHAVLAYGYTNDAWLIKNSWGTSWGEQGYIKLKRGTGGDGTCGIMKQGTYPELT
ncbi:TPA: hypothetical protein N0F65_011842 [Lagenidium giganteum]|uniref:Peptidase C1A papain C-terminal domain-containing protein n=1 Tax=Lagenidium giganteum TaxID=4803 RepID=A0AAV2Z2S8_9STRA|nr:TPA: hypothetical protein N0F65_011842 [Lagenidium giganteum]